MVQVNLAKAKSSFSEYASRAAYTDEHIIITKRGKPFVALISVKDLEFLERIKAGLPEDGLLGVRKGEWKTNTPLRSQRPRRFKKARFRT